MQKWFNDGFIFILSTKDVAAKNNETFSSKRNIEKCHLISLQRIKHDTKMERFVIIVNGFQPLTIITKRSILDVAAALDPPLSLECKFIVII